MRLATMRRLAALTLTFWLVLAACGDSEVTGPGALDTSAQPNGDASSTTQTVATGPLATGPLATGPLATGPLATGPVATGGSAAVPSSAVRTITVPVETSGDTAVDGDTAIASRIIHGMFGAVGPTSTDGVSPDGSGCAPGGSVLPDGVWFVAIESMDEATVTLDLVCRYSGEAAFARADYGGGDHLYVNDSARLRRSQVSPIAVAWLLSDGEVPDSQIPVAPSAVDAMITARGAAPWVWALMQDGLVVELWEPWDS